MRRDPLDAVFSSLVRERADWNCEVCGLNFRSNPIGLHASHCFGRIRRSVRWDPDNAAAHCAADHLRLGASPLDMSEWFLDHLGEDRTAALRIRAGKPIKLSKPQKADLLAHYRSELKRLKALRDEGRRGRIEFSA